MRRFPRTPEGRIAAEPSRGIPRGARRRASSVERATLAFSLAQTPTSPRVAVDADEREAEPDAPPRIPRAGPGPVATSDGRRRSRRSGRRPRVDGRTEPPRASATPNTRRSPRAFATPSPRPSPRASRNPGPPRTLALGGAHPGHHESPIRGAPAGPPDTGHLQCACQEFFLVQSVDRFFSRRDALRRARRRPLSGRTRVVRRVPRDRLGRSRAGRLRGRLRLAPPRRRRGRDGGDAALGRSQPGKTPSRDVCQRSS